MRKKSILGISLVLAVALMATVAFAGGMGRGFGWGAGYPYPSVPNLTTEQSSKIQALQKAHLGEIAPLQQDLLKKKTELRSLWLSPTPDQAKITALQKEMLDLQAKITQKSTNLKLETRKVLTPEQQAQLSLYGPGMGRGMGKMGRMGRW